MNDNETKALDNLRSDNYKLSDVMKVAVLKAVERASEFIDESTSAKELGECMKVIETGARTVGLTPKETQMNVQINAINGFEFVMIDEEDIKQITTTEVFDDIETEEDLT